MNSSGAAIICSHCATGGYPILLAERSDSDNDPVDSGWQFICNVELHDDVKEARVWALDEVVEMEPTLKEFINLPPSARLARKDKESPWLMEDHFDEAIAAFHCAIRLAPKAEGVSLNLFHYLWRLGKKDEALEEVKRFMSIGDSKDYREIVKERRAPKVTVTRQGNSLCQKGCYPLALVFC